MVYFLYNALANNGHGAAVLPEAEARFPDMESTRVDYVGLDIGKFFGSLRPNDIVVLSGGDGTLNRFANDLGDRELPCDIYLWKAGTGNDFLRDVADKAQDGLCLINPYLKDLPTVTVKGQDHKISQRHRLRHRRNRPARLLTNREPQARPTSTTQRSPSSCCSAPTSAPPQKLRWTA